MCWPTIQPYPARLFISIYHHLLRHCTQACRDGHFMTFWSYSIPRWKEKCLGRKSCWSTPIWLIEWLNAWTAELATLQEWMTTYEWLVTSGSGDLAPFALSSLSSILSFSLSLPRCSHFSVSCRLSADSPPQKGCYFLLSYTSMFCKVWFGHGTVGWAGANNVPWHYMMLR